MPLICPTAKGKYFCQGGLDWANQIDRPQEFAFSARRGKQEFGRFAPPSHPQIEMGQRYCHVFVIGSSRMKCNIPCPDAVVATFDRHSLGAEANSAPSARRAALRFGLIPAGS
ncbi:MAG TPA: hypothetical protein VGO54_08530 [Bradyrhizobium sp.]|jgi:hypothetical protein|nr:hypothetical protein [Bradyrhizobium sp.]